MRIGQAALKLTAPRSPKGGSTPPAYSPSLSFSDPRNSQYVVLTFFGLP